MRKSRWHGRVPITTTLVMAIGVLVMLTATIVFGVGLWLAQKNTFDLLSANANQVITADVNQIEQHLKPAEYQTRFIANLISQGEIDPTNRPIVEAHLVGALAAAPQIEAVIIVYSDFKSFGASRITSTGRSQLTIIENSGHVNIQESLDAVAKGAVWLPPIWHDVYQKAYISRAHPIEYNGKIIGAVVAEVAVEELSSFISKTGYEAAGYPFILYGPDLVLAHRLMVDGYSGSSAESPLPSLDTFTDPIISSIWNMEARDETVTHLVEGSDTHLVDVSGQDYVFVFKTLLEFGNKPMIVGAYFRGNDLPKEVQRMIAALIAGLIALVLSLITAVYLGQRIARPIVDFSSAARRIRDLDVSKVEELPGSMFRELNDQSLAFNAMLRALCWFELYVPKKIVEQLIRHGNMQESLSDAHEITVMFTDVVGFSTVSEGMVAEELAAFVNHHFSIVVDCIEKEGGIVDKFMGDAVMAFWQDSGTQENSAERACRAAIAISEAIQQDNRQRRLDDLPPIGIRIGIHTGTATVGNIGAPGRLNYTIIGDTVNIGQRLEQLGKVVYPRGTEISILISSDSAEKLTSEFALVAAGSHKLNGRVAEIDVYKLEGYSAIRETRAGPEG